MKPYFGITDFTCLNEVLAMLMVMRAHRPTPEHVLQVGVMMSRKTLYDIPTKWADAWLAKENIKQVLSDPRAYNCLHYADYEKEEDENLDLSLVRAMFYGGPQLHALQLDMIWPNPEKVFLAKQHAWETVQKTPEIILQVNAPALERVRNDSERLVTMVLLYTDAIDRILLDTSMGQGKSLDPKMLLPFIRAAKEKLPKLGVSVAGGLSAETMHLMEPIWKEFPDVSIDAQGGLRPSRNAMDPIDWDRADRYLRVAGTTNKKYQQ